MHLDKFDWQEFEGPRGPGYRVFRKGEPDCIGVVVCLSGSHWDASVWHSGYMWQTTCKSQVEAESVLAEMICRLYAPQDPVQYRKRTYYVEG